MNNSLEILEYAIRTKTPIIVNYGKGEYDDKDIKELAFWSNTDNTFISDTGVWDLRLLYEIANGEVKNTKIEKVGE